MKKNKKSSVITIAGINEGKREEGYMRQLAAIVESSDDAIISKSLDGTIRSWNKGSEKMFGYSSKEAVGKNISLIIPAEYISEEKKWLEKIHENEVVDHFETVRNKKNGEQLYVSVTISPLKDHAGNIIGVSKIARDITLRKKSEIELIHANNELAFQNVEKEKRAAELFIANKELAYENEEKEKRAAELIIANKELVFQNDEKEKRAAELIIANKELVFQNEEKEKRAAELIIANKELAFQNEEREKRAAELIIDNKELAFQNDEKEKRAAELIIANIEKEKRSTELMAANKELEQLTYIASHDLQEPLRTISNYMQIFEEDYLELLDNNARNYIRSVNNAASRMSILIHALLDFSRLGRDKKLIHVNCRDLINNVVDDLHTIIMHSNAIIDISEMPELNIYEVEMGQLFQNLITNAIKFQKKNVRPLIEIRCRKEDKSWQFSVSDNGIGVAPAHFQKIFDIFQRLHISEEYLGNGIGLANCKKIVELHGGQIWIESTLGIGTIFNFTIPYLAL